MSEIPTSPASDDEYDPELIQGLIDLAAKIRRDPPRTPAAALPILDLLRLAAPGGAGGVVTKLGKYTLQQSLGAGAYGAVWKARDDELGRTVAIKIPHSHVLLQPNLAECYAQEIELMARLDHSHIVPVHDVYREQGLVALVMAYCSGPSLAGWRRAGRPLRRNWRRRFCGIWRRRRRSAINGRSCTATSNRRTCCCFRMAAAATFRLRRS